MNKLAFWIVGLLLCGRALSMDAARTLEQLNQKAWTLADGAPPDMTSMAQTTDGTLWLGSGGGLYRFDGIRFTAFTAEWQQPFVSNEIYTLTASPDGGLWIGSRSEGVSFLKNGHIDRYGASDGIGHGTVERILVDDHGTVWVAGIWGLSRKEGSRFKPVVFDASDPHAAAWAMLQDRMGTLWVLGQNCVVARLPGENNFRQIAKRTYKSYATAQDLAEAADGSVWASRVDVRGLLRMDPPTNPQPTGNRLVPIDSSSRHIFDRDGDLWFDSVKGIGRITSASLKENLSEQQVASRAEYLTSAQSLTLIDSGSALLSDREANLWVITPAGIARLSPSDVVRMPFLTNRETPVIAAGDAGSLIVAVPVSDNTSSRVLEISGNAIVREISGPPITNSFRDANGTTWLNGPTGISKYVDGRFETTQPAQIGYQRIYAMTQDGKGALWVAFAQGSLYRYSEGVWQEAQALVPKLPRHPGILAAAVDAQGQLWLSYGRPLVIVNGAHFRVLDVDNGFNLGMVGAIVARQTHVWVGGEQGLVRFEGAQMSMIRSASGNPLARISGIVETAMGDLWLNAGVGIVHIPHAEIARATIESAYRVRYEAFTYADGVPGSAIPAHQAPTIVEGTDGRIWFSSAGGVAHIDPTHIRHNTLPPPVSIWSIESGGIQYPVTSSEIRLPAHTTNLQVSYTAGSLTAPERVQFRYKLDGLNRIWQDGGNLRDVAFANMGPGQYTLHVIAATHDDVWDTDGASVSFTIAPAFYQTKWFYGLCALLCAGLLWLIYMMRIRQVSAQFRGRLEERLAERERIARDLHDTLLQSVQGLMLRFRAAVARLPKQLEVYSQMEQALDRADEVLTEGRDRVKHLRVPSVEADLPRAIESVGEEMALEQTAGFHLTVDGIPRDLHPIVREEALFIAREALINAFRHANARQIEAELSYAGAELRLRIRDDGKGIDAELLEHGGRDGHWGLLGMRERAKTIRGTLTIWSKPGAGTEIDLRVPAHLAYRSHQRAPFRWWGRQSLSDT
jgi:signal transduction histidine kinase